MFPTHNKMVRIHTYIIHYSLMETRKPRIETLIQSLKKTKNLDFTFEYVTQYDPSTIKQEDIQKLNLTKQNTNDLFDQLIQNMHVNQISNSLKHGHAIESAAANAQNADYYLILEDDVLNGDDVGDSLVKLTSQIEKDGTAHDLFFLGMPSIKPIETPGSYESVFNSYKIFPCCDSYLAKPSTFKKMAAVYYPIRYTANIQLTHVTVNLLKDSIKVNMTTPNLFLDGSKYGVYLSSVDPNNKLLFNPDFNSLVQGVLAKTTTKSEAERLFENAKFKNHPDVMHLHSIFLIGQKEYELAQKELAGIYDIMKQNGCIMNSSTEFLKTYMRTFRYTQTMA